MVVFSRITLENFKRFKGQHSIPLKGEGPITVIAAENGVGKTTVLDAFYLALHGEKGMKSRKDDPTFSFATWLHNAYSSTAEWVDGYGKIGVRLEMNTDEGEVAIDRQFWLMEAGGEVTEETNLYIDGALLRLDAGEQRLPTIRSWIEALFPPAITQRFLIDGERLGTLDVRHLGQHMKEGLDDVLGQGTLHRLAYHLNGVKRKTIATLAPADERESLERLLQARDERATELLELAQRLQHLTADLEGLDEERRQLRQQLEMSSDEAGSELGRLRIAFAESNSHLAQARKNAMEWFSNDAPFLLTPEWLDLNALDHAKAVETLRNAALQHEVMSVLASTLDAVRPKLEAEVKGRIHTTAETELERVQTELPAAFRFLNPALMEAFTLQHAVHVDGKAEAMQEALNTAVTTLRRHETNTQALNEASQRRHGRNRCEVGRCLSCDWAGRSHTSATSVRIG